jgi:GNAT superfamily N-acetyltransferase
VPQPSPRDCAILAFTAHIVIAADVAPSWVSARLKAWQLPEAFLPPFLGELSAELDRRVNAIDMLALGEPLPGAPELALSEVDDSDHPRVRRARRYRRDVRIWLADGGLVTIGRGLGGRWEASVEVEPGQRGRGLGRALAKAARHLAPDGRPLWAQITPGNAASVRAFLAAGYLPVAQEALLVPVE